MDLLKRLKSEELDEEKLELSLGLSSNGRFGVERRRAASNDISGDNDHNNYNNNRLIRASSIGEFSNLTPESDDPTSLTLYPAITRTSSLPIEPEVEWKKRKELQSLRRSEAKRKRVEKIRNGRVVNESSPPSRLPPLPRPAVVPVQVGSPASGGSSGVSDLESQPVAGANKETELKSTASQQPVSRQISSSIAYRSNSIPSQTTINGNMSKDATLKMMFADMPCVTTKGDGVNGKKIEGFLYRYRKGEEVRIVCVCHGSFLTPAEFVKHGGGGDVEHPLRHIVVIPPSL